MWNPEICQDPSTCDQDDLVLSMPNTTIRKNQMTKSGIASSISFSLLKMATYIFFSIGCLNRLRYSVLYCSWFISIFWTILWNIAHTAMAGRQKSNRRYLWRERDALKARVDLTCSMVASWFKMHCPALEKAFIHESPGAYLARVLGVF